MLEESFSQGNSVLHHVDPRGKVISAFFLVLAIAFSHNLNTAFLAFGIACFVLFICSLPLPKVARTLFIANAFIAFLWIFLPFSLPGEALFSIGKMKATWQGVKLAIVVTLKCNSILLIIICFIATIPIPSLGFALESLGVPDKLVFLLLMSYRYMHVISDEYNRLLQAAKVRGFVPRTNIHTYRTYAYLLAMVFIRSYERGVRVYEAMLLRGFKGKFYCLRRFDFKKRDHLLMFGAILCSIVIFWMDHPLGIR